MCRGSRLAPVFFQYVFSHDEELLLNNGGLGYIPSLLSKFYVIGVMHFSNKWSISMYTAKHFYLIVGLLLNVNHQ